MSRPDGVTLLAIPDAGPLFEGHFPGFALMPGVLLIECVAQTCGWMTSAINRFSGLPALAGVKDAKLREPVFPGHSLEFDGKSERFKDDKDADKLLTREYRKGFEISEKT